MTCCNPFTGECGGEGHGCAAHIEPVCPPCTGDCNQGRTCPARYPLQPVVTHDADSLTVTEWHAPQVDAGLPIISFDQPHQWLRDLFFRAMFWLAVAASSVIAIGCVGFIAEKFGAPDASPDIHQPKETP